MAIECDENQPATSTTADQPERHVTAAELLTRTNRDRRELRRLLVARLITSGQARSATYRLNLEERSLALGTDLVSMASEVLRTPPVMFCVIYNRISFYNGPKPYIEGALIPECRQVCREILDEFGVDLPPMDDLPGWLVPAEPVTEPEPTAMGTALPDELNQTMPFIDRPDAEFLAATEPMPPADWLEVLRDRIYSPLPEDDVDALRAMLADAERDATPPPAPCPPGTLPADLALPFAAILRAVAKRIEARAHP